MVDTPATTVTSIQLDNSPTMTTISSAATITNIDEQNRNFFLDNKGVYKNDSKREMEFYKMNYPESILDKKEQERYMGAKKRVDLLMDFENSSIAEDVAPLTLPSWSDFCKQIPAWQSSNESYVVWRDHPNCMGRNILVQSSQKTGNCYLHAPVVMQHYLVAMNSSESVGMINLQELLKRYDSEQLKDYIFNVGGDSKMTLESILEDGTEIETTDLEMCIHRLENNGPILVELFQVHPEFLSSDVVHVGSYPKRQTEDYHAMIIIGHRKEKDEIRFLLQNWWDDKQFIEVDKLYLRSCGPSYYFVQTPQTKISTGPITLSAYQSASRHLEKRSCRTQKEGPITGKFT